MSRTSPIRAAIKAELKASCWRFYVYVLLRPEGDPFYIGCSGAAASCRLFDHESYARSGEQSLRSSIIRKIWSEGGCVGYRTRWTPEAREAMRQKALERYRNDPSLRLKIGAAQEGRWTKEERQKQAERAKLGILRPDVREKNVRIVKAIFADPVRLAAHADAAKRRAAQRPEIKKSLSVAQTENWKDPEYRARTIQSMNLSIAKRKAAQIPMGRTKKSVAS